MSSRNAASGLSLVQSGQWPKLGWAPFGLCGPQIGVGPTQKSFTVGFLGMGRIALATLHRLIPFRITRAIYTDSGRGTGISDDHVKALIEHGKFGNFSSIDRVSLQKLASESDLIFLLAPGK
jgi:glyoxylate/hydroxypyruvate reductase